MTSTRRRILMSARRHIWRRAFEQTIIDRSDVGSTSEIDAFYDVYPTSARRTLVDWDTWENYSILGSCDDVTESELVRVTVRIRMSSDNINSAGLPQLFKVTCDTYIAHDTFLQVRPRRVLSEVSGEWYWVPCWTMALACFARILFANVRLLTVLDWLVLMRLTWEKFSRRLQWNGTKPATYAWSETNLRR